MTHRDDDGIDGGEGFKLDERFADWVDGRLDPAELAQLEDELRRDEDLRAAADQYRAMVGLLRSELPSHPELEPPADLVPRVLDQLATPPPRRRLGPLLGSLLAAAAMISLMVILTETLGPGRLESEEELALNESSEDDDRATRQRHDKQREPQFRAARPPESERSDVAKAVGGRKALPLTDKLQKSGQGQAGKSVKPIVVEKSAEKDAVRGDSSGALKTRSGLGADGKKQAENRVTTGSDDWKLAGGERGRFRRTTVDKQASKVGALNSKQKALDGQAAAELPAESNRRNLGVPASTGQPGRSLRDLALVYLKEVATLEEVAKRPVRARSASPAARQAQGRTEESKVAVGTGLAGERKADSKASGNADKKTKSRDSANAEGIDRKRSALFAQGKGAVETMPVLVFNLPGVVGSLVTKESVRGVSEAPIFKYFLSGKKAVEVPDQARTLRITEQLKPSTQKVAVPVESQQYGWRAGDDVYMVHGDQAQLQKFFLELRGYLAETAAFAARTQQLQGKNGATGPVRMRIQRAANRGLSTPGDRPEDLYFMLVLRRAQVVPAKRK
ncbi:MAG: hypothetical protein VX951_12565 [Planctomycetota bacterium]|nr:hypothetical protein [Planctomycetota bacterium]